MPRIRPVIDPRLIRLKAKEQEAAATYERLLSRMSRAFRAMDKARRRLASVRKRIEQRKAEIEAPHPA